MARLNQFKTKNSDAFLLASITGSEGISESTIVFGIPRNPFPEKTTQINPKKARKCWHFLFGLEKLPQTQ